MYNLLKSNPNKWWTCEEIKQAVPDIVVVDDPRNPSPELTALRIKLNAMAETDKIITTKKHKFKIANLEEYLEERARHIARIKSEVAQVEAQDKKYQQDGQVKLFNNILEELKPTNEQMHETFMPQEIDGVKVYTRVAIDWKHKVYYVITAQKIRIEYADGHYYCVCILANGKEVAILDVMSNTYAYDDFIKNHAYIGFRKEIIK